MVSWLAVVGLAACRPSDVLTVPAPSGVLPSGALQNQTGAELAFNGAKAKLFSAADGQAIFGSDNGVLMWTGMLADEFSFAGFSYAGGEANTDARMTAGRGAFGELTDQPWEYLLRARSALLLSLPGLAQYEPSSGQSKIGEAYALAGYAELVIAEAYCAGTPLDQVRAVGGAVQYGPPLSTDSLLGAAEAHFDSALAAAHGDATVLGLASVGLGRALLDRGQWAAAATAVTSVPTSFVYNTELEPRRTMGAAQNPGLYALGVEFDFGRIFNVADRKGGNGLDFVSAHDPRLMFDTTNQTYDGLYAGAVPGTWYLPTKFTANLSFIPLATGIETRLIEAEAALKAGQTGTWLADLNALRTGGCTVPGVDSTCTLGTGQVPNQRTGLASLSDPGTDSGRVSLTFRERAFWLFGTGTRLGDLRRLIRQYGRDQSVVFPTGPYPNAHNVYLPAPIPSYGTDVNLTLPTPFGLGSNGITESNPNYRGCIAPTTAA